MSDELQYSKFRAPTPYCGHDFWDDARTKNPGDIVLCNRCKTFFVKSNQIAVIVEHVQAHWQSNPGERIFSPPKIETHEASFYYPISIQLRS
jgi:hypothetical protein